MIRNGLYLAETRFLDGVEAYNRHIMVLAEFEATALAGKQSFRFKSTYRLLFAD